MRTRSLGLMAVLICTASLFGCKKQVPTDIVQTSLRNALRSHAPMTSTAMCGTKVRGLINANVTNVQRKPDGTSGTAHISGSPWMTTGAPSSCEGDVEFKYTYSQKRTGVRKRKTTTTTWYLEHIKLTAVQTKGVAFKSIDEDATDDDDDDAK